MSERTLTLFFVLFLISVGLYFYVQHREHAGARSILVPLGQKEWQQATSLEVRYQDRGFRLVKEQGRWLVVDGFLRPAKEEKVENLLKELATLHGEPRAKGKKYFSRFKLNPKEALKLTLKKDGQTLVTLWVGKRGPQWESSFVRLGEGDEIYLVPLNLLAKFEIWADNPTAPSAKAFVDRKVLDLKAQDLKYLAYQDHQAWTLRREGEDFLFSAGKKEKKLSEDQVSTFLKKVFPLFAEELVPPEEFSTSQGRLRYETKTGLSGELLIGPCQKESDRQKKDSKGKQQTRSWCLLKRGEFVYRVKEESLRALWKPPLGQEKK